MADDVWDPDLYQRFLAERTKPGLDLIALVLPAESMRIADLGCGTGKLTAELHGKLTAASTLGVDSSPAMLEQANVLAQPGLHFEQADILTWSPAVKLDLVFSNAALQWLGDHPGLLRKLSGWLAEKGQLAIQVPQADDHPSHTVATRLGEKYGTGPLYPGRHNVLSPEGYSELLFHMGFEQQQVFSRIYGHLLPSLDAMVQFFRSTLLNPWRKALGEDGFKAFLQEYREALKAELGEPEPLFFPMKRTLIWARR
ncbi:MAG: methyltransferase domain-containing protein [Planctomycetes bacterium]|nr:methyltransferase domain-containing protein [Planctomycetota bacterium]